MRPLACLPYIGGVLGVFLAIFGTVGSQKYEQYDVTYENQRGQRRVVREDNTGGGAVMLIVLIIFAYVTLSIYNQIFEYLRTTWAVFLLPICIAAFFPAFRLSRYQNANYFGITSARLIAYSLFLGALLPGLFLYLDVWVENRVDVFLWFKYLLLIPLMTVGIVGPVIYSLFVLAVHYKHQPSVKQMILTPVNFVLLASFILPACMYWPEVAEPYLTPIYNFLDPYLWPLERKWNNFWR